MPASLSTPRRIAFGPYEADLHSGELRKHGIKIRLQSQPFQLLTMLLERPGELVTREEICQKLWPADTFVDFDHSLGTAINKIREVLNDSAAEPRFVETLPRRGYRFIAPVTPVDSDPATPPPPVELAKATCRSRTFYPVVGVCAALVLLGSALLTWKFLRPHPVESIAVLPLANLSADPTQQFFPDGVTDELITNLAQIGSLRVISHTSAMAYAGTHKSAPQIARELGVDALVEGSVVRSGDRVRITVQLIQAASDRHLWAHTYDLQLSDVLTVQGELARAIAAGISHTLTPREEARLSQPRPVNPEVALLYFKGSYFLTKLDTDRAKEMFEQAIRVDPNSAESWAGLADTYHTMVALGGENSNAPLAKDSAYKALEIDPNQAQALMVLGIISAGYDWNPTASEVFFRRSLAARPGYAWARMLYAVTLAHYGKFEEAIQQAKLASALDPVSVLTNSMAWHVYFCARHYDEALRIILAAKELDPTFGPAYFRLTISLEQKGEYQKAIEAGSEDPSLSAALASGGARGYWQRKLELGAGPSQMARAYMRLGRREEALQVLEKAYQMHDGHLLLWMPAYEEFDPLRSDPRFQKLLHGMGIS